MLRKTLDIYIEEVKAAFPDAQLVEVRDIEPIPWCDAFDKHLAEVREEGSRRLFYAELLWAAYEMGRKLGWAAVFYKDTYGAWPPWDWKDTQRPIETSEATWKMIRSRDRKSREAWKEKKRAERQAELEAAEARRATGQSYADAWEDRGLERQPADEAEAGERASAEGSA